jgi:hypothetical protein
MDRGLIAVFTPYKTSVFFAILRACKDKLFKSRGAVSSDWSQVKVRKQMTYQTENNGHRLNFIPSWILFGVILCLIHSWSYLLSAFKGVASYSSNLADIPSKFLDMDSNHEKTFTYRPLSLNKGENKIKKQRHTSEVRSVDRSIRAAYGHSYLTLPSGLTGAPARFKFQSR